MSKLSELKALLAAIDEKLDKARIEITTKIDELQNALVDVEIPADAQAALDELATAAQALDDVVPDVAPPVE